MVKKSKRVLDLMLKGAVKSKSEEAFNKLLKTVYFDLPENILERYRTLKLYLLKTGRLAAYAGVFGPVPADKSGLKIPSVTEDGYDVKLITDMYGKYLLDKDNGDEYFGSDDGLKRLVNETDKINHEWIKKMFDSADLPSFKNDDDEGKFLNTELRLAKLEMALAEAVATSNLSSSDRTDTDEVSRLRRNLEAKSTYKFDPQNPNNRLFEKYFEWRTERLEQREFYDGVKKTDPYKESARIFANIIDDYSDEILEFATTGKFDEEATENNSETIQEGRGKDKDSTDPILEPLILEPPILQPPIQSSTTTTTTTTTTDAKKITEKFFDEALDLLRSAINTRKQNKDAYFDASTAKGLLTYIEKNLSNYLKDESKRALFEYTKYITKVLEDDDKNPGSMFKKRPGVGQRNRRVIREGEREEEKFKQCEPIDSDVTFADLAGATEEKMLLEQILIEPVMYPENSPDVRSVLFYGPPGTGKSFLVRAAVGQLKAKMRGIQVEFFNADGASLKGGLLGETEKRIKGLFECAADRATANNGLSVIFLDELDAVGGKREGYDAANMTTSVNALISVIEGANSKKFEDIRFLGATNRPWSLDSTFLSRFGEKYLVDIPNDLTRAQIISNELQKFYVTSTLKYRENYTLELKQKLETYLPKLKWKLVDGEKKMESQTYRLFSTPVVIKVPELVWEDDELSEHRWDNVLKKYGNDLNFPYQMDLIGLLWVVKWTGMSSEIHKKTSLRSTRTKKIIWDDLPDLESHEKHLQDVFGKEYTDYPKRKTPGYSARDITKLVTRTFSNVGSAYLRRPKKVPELPFNPCNGDELVDASENDEDIFFLSKMGETNEKLGFVNLPPEERKKRRQCIKNKKLSLEDFREAIRRVPSAVESDEYVRLVRYSEDNYDSGDNNEDKNTTAVDKTE